LVRRVDDDTANARKSNLVGEKVVTNSSLVAQNFHMLFINPGHVRFAVFLSCGAFIELCKRRGRRPMRIRPLPLPPPSPPSSVRRPREELASYSSPEFSRSLSSSNVNNNNNNNNNNSEPIQCRFCFGTDLGDMISPCNCSGSAGHVHARCLRHWQSVSLQNSGNTGARNKTFSLFLFLFRVLKLSFEILSLTLSLSLFVLLPYIHIYHRHRTQKRGAECAKRRLRTYRDGLDGNGYWSGSRRRRRIERTNISTRGETRF